MAENGSAPRPPAVLVVNDRVNQRVAMRSMLVALKWRWWRLSRGVLRCGLCWDRISRSS
jgi:hypothetical protein